MAWCFNTQSFTGYEAVERGASSRSQSVIGQATSGALNDRYFVNSKCWGISNTAARGDGDYDWEKHSFAWSFMNQSCTGHEEYYRTGKMNSLRVIGLAHYGEAIHTAEKSSSFSGLHTTAISGFETYHLSRYGSYMSVDNLTHSGHDVLSSEKSSRCWSING